MTPILKEIPPVYAMPVTLTITTSAKSAKATSSSLTLEMKHA